MTKIRAALVKAFTDAALFPSTSIQWENLKFTPPTNGTQWAAVFFMPAQPDVASLGVAGRDEVNGVLQIDLNYPLGSGEAEAMAKFEQVRAIYRAGFGFAYDGQTATIRSCGRSPGRIVNNYYRISATIEFYAHINR